MSADILTLTTKEALHLSDELEQKARADQTRRERINDCFYRLRGIGDAISGIQLSLQEMEDGYLPNRGCHRSCLVSGLAALAHACQVEIEQLEKRVTVL